MTTYLDLYCERTAPGLWAEPVNALTNGFFFIAALCAYFMAYKRQANGKRQATNPDIILLLALLCAIGTGSSLFHIYAQYWAALADTIPIFLFQLCWLSLYAKNIIRLKTPFLLALIASFILASFLSGLLPHALLNGSLSYLPALLFLTGLAAYHIRTKRAGRFYLATAAVIFLLSLTFRSLDMALCPFIPLGVHFLWHILNALVLYLALAAYILNKPRAQRIAADDDAHSIFGKT